MQYRYAQNRNFEDFASGRVFYTSPGQPVFPVRLASEVFQRALRLWQAAGGRGLCTIYDPVCGSAYWLSVLAYLHWEAIAAIYASDVDPKVLPLAERNLSLITSTGLDQRLAEIEAMKSMYKKESHAGALVSAEKLREQLVNNLGSHAIESKVFQTDAANLQNMRDILGRQQIDLVLADVPYGWHSEWRMRGSEPGGANDELVIKDVADQTPVWQMLNALGAILNSDAVVAVVTDKSQKVKHEKYHRLSRFQVGKRRISILKHQ